MIYKIFIIITRGGNTKDRTEDYNRLDRPKMSVLVLKILKFTFQNSFFFFKENSQNRRGRDRIRPINHYL